jgi:hypothetical protein
VVPTAHPHTEALSRIPLKRISLLDWNNLCNLLVARALRLFGNRVRSATPDHCKEASVSVNTESKHAARAHLCELKRGRGTPLPSDGIRGI